MKAAAYDAIVAGSGPAGSIAAYCLAHTGVSVLLVDWGPAATMAPDTDAPAGQAVGDSLPAAARRLLERLDLGHIMAAGGHLPSLGTVSAWGAPALAMTDSLLNPDGPGWRLNRTRFDADLRSAASAAGAVRRSGPVRTVARIGDRWQVSLPGGTAEARIVVDSTGRRAAVARRAGAQRHRDAPLAAVCTWFTPDDGGGSGEARPEDSRVLIEAAPDGWWYGADLPQRVRTAVFHTTPEHVRLLRSQSHWREALDRTEHIRKLTEGAIRIGRLQCAEACGARTAPYAGDGWVAAGDAALSFDPISSQGIFNALYTGMAAARAVEAALCGSSAAIPEYIERLHAIRAAYVRHRAIYYQAEDRWPDRPFWAAQRECRID